MALIERIRSTVPHVAINTDIIVGFCGETAEQFEHTVEVVADCAFDKVHLSATAAPGHCQRTAHDRRRP